jgi:hypothetical protein
LVTISHWYSGYYKRLLLRKAVDEILVEFSKTAEDQLAAFFANKQKHVSEVIDVRCLTGYTRVVVPIAYSFQHANQCQQWSESVTSSRKNELETLRRDRKDAYGRHHFSRLFQLRLTHNLSIIARITEAGYKPELDYMGIYLFEAKEKALFRVAKPLTTQGGCVVE